MSIPKCFNHAKLYKKICGSIQKSPPCLSRPKCLCSSDTVYEGCKKTVLIAHDEGEALSSRLASVLQNCVDASFVEQGRQTHAQVIVSGLGRNGLLGGKVLGMYVLCGAIADAKNAFYQLPLGYTLPWNWMIRGFTMMGWFQFALVFYFKMLGIGVSPDKYTFPYVIKACGGLGSTIMGKMVHETISLMGLSVDVFIGSSLIKLYADYGCLDEAQYLFDNMPEKDCVLWNVMLNGYVRNGDSGSAMSMFLEMRSSYLKPNSITLASVLSVCASESMLNFGTQLHGLAVSCGLELDSPVANTLLAMYSKCQCVSEGRKLFDMLQLTDLVTWNAMLSGYVQNALTIEAADLFNRMVSAGIKPDSITLASFLPSIAEPVNLKHAKEIHGYIVRCQVPLDVFLQSALIDAYLNCGDVKVSEKIFSESSSTDVVVGTTMISGYSLNGMNSEALETFRWLLQEKMRPNSVTLSSVLPACAGLASLKLGKELHGSIIKNALAEKCHVGSAILDMYAKCGRLDLARQVFDRMKERDAVCWNSMITSYSQNGKPEEAIDLFRQMGMEGQRYDSVSISGALSACSNLPALHHGKAIHGLIIKNELISDIFSESSLIDMYAKCGNVNSAHRVFNLMRVKNEVSWNSIITAYGNHGHLKDTLDLFHEMLENKVQPDHVTFIGIISACGHAGHVDAGVQYFQCMTEEYGIPARMEHYACMVDLFGRAGRLNEAYETIKSMPFPPDAGVWGTLLGACRVHGNVDLAEVASSHLLDLDPQNSGYYVLLANIHADAGKWGSVLKIRSLMKERGVQKIPGYSWIEVNTTKHMFVAADGSHPLSDQIYLVLNSLLLELRREGYIPKPYLPVYHQTREIPI